VADSDAVRKRRQRAHRAGDHSLCRPERCSEAGPPDGERELEAAVVRYLDGLDLSEDDARSLVGNVAVRLARSLDGRVSAAMARELRGCLHDLRAVESPDDGQAAAQAQRILNDLKALVR
jgi:hypothetical protein